MKKYQPIYSKPRKTIQKILSFRVSFLQSFFIVLSCLLFIRLAYLQCYQYMHYSTLSLKNQMSIIPITPSRGIIFDRNGKILAENQPVFVLEVIPEHVPNLNDSLKKIQKLIPTITNEDITRFEKERRQHRRDTPTVLKMQLTSEEVAIFSSHQYKFPGINLKARLMRYYPLKKQMAHIIGYVGRINLEELGQIDNVNYQGTNFIGKIGIEKYYENILHGKVGYEQVETNVSGKIIRTIFKQPPVSGHKIYLTIDSRLQKVAYDGLKGLEGSAVLLDVKKGEVLALVSRPSFNPNLFTNGISGNDFKKLLFAPERPLFHRAIRGLYPPASTVKPFVAIAGLSKGVVVPQTTIYDPGWYRLPGVRHSYRDWKRTGHGFTNLKRAIMVSCDTYFYQLGSKLGIANLSEMMGHFGFGKLTGIDLPEELAGLYPNANWKRINKRASWYPGDTIITSIGQGFTLASPLQLANATAALSQSGGGYKPHLLQKTIDDSGVINEFQPIKKEHIQLPDDQYWQYVHEAMQAVIESNEGTGARFGRDAFYTVAGKTGTAQVFSLSQNDHNKKTIITNKALKDHSWFIAFAPVEDPQVAVAVMVEHDTAASHIARLILDSYFTLNKESTKS
ncbi:MAG: penicillin-binding protein 2 [Gammaproteobacteria bacterium]|nr:penicillin-binding protein 2 [Gammaproteobacteria bacterium]